MTGGGGVDSELISFRATPGEKVTVTSGLFTEFPACRACEGPLLDVANLGELTLGGRFPEAHEIVPKAPLEVTECGYCALVQLKHSVIKAELFEKGYGYKSALNQSMVRHLKGVAHTLCQTARVSSDDIVLDIGCNDGTLLRHLREQPFDLQLYGFDPNAEPVDGAEVVKEYFTATDFLVQTNGRKAKAISSIAMFYDLDHPVQFAKQVAECLAKNGVWIIEVGDLCSLVKGAWDAICHEHVLYFDEMTLDGVLGQAGLRIFRLDGNDVNGGTIRAYVCHADSKNYPERGRAGLRSASIYGLEDRIFRDAATAYDVVNGLSGFGDVDVYGASTKGNTLLQVAEIDHKVIRQAIDINPDKAGKVTPGTNIPIKNDEVSALYNLVLPWHFKTGILEREKAALENSSRFIFPLPEFTIA